ncbi:hypothetical protein [Kozakia baliensis]|uniref:hypothetical protein n=1 Tax=Kozakia baliensis TaxID=153496 RepID=UPI001362C57A|nr:hypothetical protein [Kozakia baliensis]
MERTSLHQSGEDHAGDHDRFLIGFEHGGDNLFSLGMQNQNCRRLAVALGRG